MEQAQVIGTVVLAMSGVFAVADRRLDWFGATVVGVVTALGGGTVRDLVLGVSPAFWVTAEGYLVAAAAGAVAAIAMVSLFRDRTPRFELGLRVADAAGLALFSYVGAEVTLSLGFSPVMAVLMAVTTGIGGGLIRDTISGRTPLVLTEEIYALAALAGASLYVALSELTAVPLPVAAICGMGITLCLRLVSLHRDWSLPNVAPPENR